MEAARMRNLWFMDEHECLGMLTWVSLNSLYELDDGHRGPIPYTEGISLTIGMINLVALSLNWTMVIKDPCHILSVFL